MSAHIIRLVDNEYFFDFISDGIGSSEFNENVQGLFLTSEGASSYFYTRQELSEALEAMYYQRVEFGLEYPAIQLPPVFSTVETCS